MKLFLKLNVQLKIIKKNLIKIIKYMIYKLIFYMKKQIQNWMVKLVKVNKDYKKCNKIMKDRILKNLMK